MRDTSEKIILGGIWIDLKDKFVCNVSLVKCVGEPSYVEYTSMDMREVCYKIDPHKFFEVFRIFAL